MALQAFLRIQWYVNAVVETDRRPAKYKLSANLPKDMIPPAALKGVVLVIPCYKEKTKNVYIQPLFSRYYRRHVRNLVVIQE